MTWGAHMDGRPLFVLTEYHIVSRLLETVETMGKNIVGRPSWKHLNWHLFEGSVSRVKQMNYSYFMLHAAKIFVAK